MREVTRWVCSACGGIWFVPNANKKCPACNGTGEEKLCVEDGAGVVTPKPAT